MEVVTSNRMTREKTAMVTLDLPFEEIANRLRGGSET
jgi:hypothetical protein